MFVLIFDGEFFKAVLRIELFLRGWNLTLTWRHSWPCIPRCHVCICYGFIQIVAGSNPVGHLWLSKDLQSLTPIGDWLYNFFFTGVNFLREIIEIRSHAATPIYVAMIHIVSSYCAYIISKFACKIVIQNFSFAFPIALTVPLTVISLIAGKKICFHFQNGFQIPFCSNVIRPKTSPNLNFCSIKIAHRTTYV